MKKKVIVLFMILIMIPILTNAEPFSDNIPEPLSDDIPETFSDDIPKTLQENTTGIIMESKTIETKDVEIGSESMMYAAKEEIQINTDEKIIQNSSDGEDNVCGTAEYFFQKHCMKSLHKGSTCEIFIANYCNHDRENDYKNKCPEDYENRCNNKECECSSEHYQYYKSSKKEDRPVPGDLMCQFQNNGYNNYNCAFQFKQPYKECSKEAVYCTVPFPKMGRVKSKNVSTPKKRGKTSDGSNTNKHKSSKRRTVFQNLPLMVTSFFYGIILGSIAFFLYDVCCIRTEDEPMEYEIMV